jgi:hypothetical protein
MKDIYLQESKQEIKKIKKIVKISKGDKLFNIYIYKTYIAG